jgi:DNA-binding winged helix-turn-helix (wHTH) protein/TolB-like protein
MQDFPKTRPSDGIAYHFGPFRLVPSQHLLFHGTEPVRLTPKLYDLLQVLVVRHGNVVSHDDLMATVWAETFVEEANLTVSVSLLRKVFRELDSGADYITTIPKRGYRFVAPVHEVRTVPESLFAGAVGPDSTITPAAVPDTRPPADGGPESADAGDGPAVSLEHRLRMPSQAGLQASRTEPLAKRHWLYRWSVAAGAMGVCATFVLVGASSLHRPAAIGSIAVLPFDFSGTGNRAYFAEILTEELTTSLAQFPTLRVISRRSANHYNGAGRPLDEIAKELKVDAVVQGSVRADGEQIRVTARVIRAADDAHLWAGSYTKQAPDIVTVPAELSRAIAGEIRIKISAEQQAALARSRAITPEAYEAFLRGLAEFRQETVEGNESAIAQFERAIALAPDFDRAYAAFAVAQGYRYMRWAPTPDLLRDSRAAIQKALDINSGCAEAYVARARLADVERSSRRTPSRLEIDDYRRALAIDPNLAPAHFYLGDLYMHYGLLEKASAEFNAALALDPDYPQLLYRLPRLHLYQQEYQAALTEFQKSRYTPNWQLPLVLSQLSRQREALDAIETMHRDYPFDPDVAGAYAVLLAKEGRKEDTEAQIRIAIERGESKDHFHHAEYDIGSAYALMSQTQRAVEWLRRAATEGLPCYPLFAHDPNLNGIRDDPGFRSFLEGLRREWENLNATL